MPVISVVQSKGGVGKSTACLILATELARAGKAVTLIDADPNHPLVEWAKLPGLPANVTVIADQSEETIVDTIEEARERTPFVIVDLEGTASARVTFAAASSDLVLIPLQGSALDANQAVRAIKLIRSTGRTRNREIPFAMLFTRMPPALVSRNFKAIEGQLLAGSIPMLPVWLYEREAFKSLFSRGGTLHTLDRSAVSNIEAARENAAAFVMAVVQVLQQAKSAEAAYG
ncbi:MAG: chromosome partitioning protein [Aliidongia sp.]|nr:chromosome partitioning protein [Aliidongia sp.]